MATRPEGGYTQKSFLLPNQQVRWLRQLRKDAFAEDLDLHEVVVVREALDRLMRTETWKTLRPHLMNRLATGPQRGRPK